MLLCSGNRKNVHSIYGASGLCELKFSVSNWMHYKWSSKQNLEFFVRIVVVEFFSLNTFEFICNECLLWATASGDIHDVICTCVLLVKWVRFILQSICTVGSLANMFHLLTFLLLNIIYPTAFFVLFTLHFLYSNCLFLSWCCILSCFSHISEIFNMFAHFQIHEQHSYKDAQYNMQSLQFSQFLLFKKNVFYFIHFPFNPCYYLLFSDFLCSSQ